MITSQIKLPMPRNLTRIGSDRSLFVSFSSFFFQLLPLSLFLSKK